MLIDPPIMKSWRARCREKREVAWGLSVGRASQNARAGGMRGSLYLRIPLSFNLTLGVMGLLKYSG